MNIYKFSDNKFKSIYFSCNYTMQAEKEDISYYNVIASLLGKTNRVYKTQKKIEEYLYSLYGAGFDVNVEKIGDLFNIEFKLEFINSKFLPKKEDITEKCISFIHNMIYNSIILDENMDAQLLEREKQSVLEKILTRKDDKLKYAVNKSEEILYEDETFGTFIYGDEEIVRKVTLEDMKKYYSKLLNESAMTFIVTGNLDGIDDIESIISDVFTESCSIDYQTLKVNKNENGSGSFEEKKENLDSAQSVITMGFKLNDVTKEDFFALNVYNAVLGATPSSKLFQNFREKESLAYTVRSRYYRYKNLILIYAGIEYKNYEKAKEVLKKEIDDIKNGNVSMVEFEAAKESLIAELNEVEDSKVAVAKFIISNLFYYKNNDMTVQNMIQKIKEVTLDEVIAVSKKLDLKLIYLLGGEANV